MGIAEATIRHPEGTQRHAGRANEALIHLDPVEGGHAVEFARLAHTFEALEGTSSLYWLLRISVRKNAPWRTLSRPFSLQ
jgi:hypothetical protein